MNPGEHAAIVRRVFHAVNAGDIDAVCADCSEEIEWRPAFTGGGLVDGVVYQGYEGLARFLEVQRETLETVGATILSTQEFGDMLLLEVHLDAAGRARHAHVECRTWNVFKIRDRKIVSGVVYLGEDEALRALGM